MGDNPLLKMYKTAIKYPLGRTVFSAKFARFAPYFRTIHPVVTELRVNHCEVLLRKRKSVQNHIGTVHAIAIANGLEMAMGGMAEASIPKHLRWIPKGMDINYIAKAETDLICHADVDPEDWVPGDMNVRVVARDMTGKDVVTGVIRLWISEKPKR